MVKWWGLLAIVLIWTFLVAPSLGDGHDLTLRPYSSDHAILSAYALD